MTKEEKDAEKFENKTLTLEKRLGRDLRPDEVLLLALYESVNASEEDEKKKESSKDAEDNVFSKKVNALERCLGIRLRIDEILLLTMFNSTKVDAADKDDENLIFNKKITALEQHFGRKLRPSEDLLLTLFELFDSIDVNKIKDKEPKLKKMQERDKKEESKKKASNHEFSDAIAEAALEICGIDLKKKKEDQND